MKRPGHGHSQQAFPFATATPPAPTADEPRHAGDAALRARLLLVHERLCEAYHCPIAFFHELDPLSELVSSLLSHRTRNADSARAYRALRARFPTWEAVRDGDVAEVERAIGAATWPELKAPRLQEILRHVSARHGAGDGALSLDFLGAMPVEEARRWLEELPGVGPKTSAAVLLFSTLRRGAMPVDSHHHRVAVRLALVPSGLPVGPSHARLEALLPAGWTPQQIDDHHEVMMFHGQRCCHHRDPECERCPVVDVCPHGQGRLHTRAGREKTL